jgi:hypothetical protein
MASKAAFHKLMHTTYHAKIARIFGSLSPQSRWLDCDSVLVDSVKGKSIKSHTKSHITLAIDLAGHNRGWSECAHRVWCVRGT